MKAVVQRVSAASVRVEGAITGEIGRGLLVLLGVGVGDSEKEALAIAAKISKLRIFEDQDGKMNLSVKDVGGGVLAVSQFTLLGDASKGNRPSFIEAARPGKAKPLYELFCRSIADCGIEIGKGVFGAHMDVSLVNDGPVTIILEV
ncbi:MAG: D-tyrosyl-tRNA(Tyr) deacylase [Planctomycetes bacterium]|nr:D-tyrosyl-tRNA(Tyr) deacylase [Planctomycetota bacterium]